ncbi:MAG: hypothetical protein QME62_08655, partial [Armatimonadota bacterium]|nr:hypothetical protein [Armatimonadota bacterium]
PFNRRPCCAHPSPSKLTKAMIFTEEKPSEKLVFTLYLSAKTEKTLKRRFKIISIHHLTLCLGVY